MLDKRGLIVFLILLALVIGCVIFKIIVIIEYGGKPVSEIPTWVVWVLND